MLLKCCSNETIPITKVLTLIYNERDKLKGIGLQALNSRSAAELPKYEPLADRVISDVLNNVGADVSGFKHFARERHLPKILA
jgi:hypothetical protein